MQAAGLNPMLALSQGPASTPGNSAATVNPVDALGRGISSASDVAARALTIKQQQANIQLTLANAYKAQSEGTSAAAQAKWAADNAMLDNMIKGEQWTNLKRQYDLTDQQAKQIEQMLPLLLATEKSRADLNQQQTSSAKTAQRSEELKQSELEVTSKWFESQLGGGGRAANFMKDLLQIWTQIRGAVR